MLGGQAWVGRQAGLSPGWRAHAIIDLLLTDVSLPTFGPLVYPATNPQGVHPHAALLNLSNCS